MYDPAQRRLADFARLLRILAAKGQTLTPAGMRHLADRLDAPLYAPPADLCARMGCDNPLPPPRRMGAPRKYCLTHSPQRKVARKVPAPTKLEP